MMNRITEPFASLWLYCDAFAEHWSICWTERRNES